MGGIRIYILLLAAVLLCGLAAILPLAWSGSDILSASYRDTAERELESNARLFWLALASQSTDTSSADMTRLARIARDESDTRYTILEKDGTVIADSDEDAARMENHLNRPEIQSALQGATGSSIRPSPTLGTDWMYVAVPVDTSGMVIRAAASMQALDARLGQWWKRSLAGLAASFAILVIAATLISRLFSRPIEHAATGAEHYAQGDFSYRLPVEGAAEMRRLSAAMGFMATELDARFNLLSRQKEEMRVIFENMSEGVLAVDDDGQIILVNTAAQSILHFTAESTGAVIETAVRNADLLHAIRETAATGIANETETQLQNDAGSEESIVHIQTARIQDSGKNIGVLVVLRDVTRLRKLETMRRDFVANVSHELRTPITAIQSCLETLHEEADETGGPIEFVDMALRNTRRMGAIIENLLFLAGMESGQSKDTGKVGVSPVLPVLREAVTICGDDSYSRNIAITVDCDETLSALMNPQLVVHALVNLLDNAIKYGPENGVITLTAERHGGLVRISVSDQGPGIAPKFQSRVFERFYRVDGTTRIKKGSGLGLAIVKHIALSQGGDIRLESEIGAGSTFTLSLPYA